MTGMIIAAAVLGLVVVLVFVALRGRGASSAGPIHAERLHDWENDLSEAHEDALIHGIEAWRDRGHDLLLHHEGGKLDVLEPPMVVSLYALKDAFTKKGGNESAVGEVLDGWAKEAAPGVLHLSPEPKAEKIAARASTMLETVTAEIPGIETLRVDELRGTLELGLRLAKVSNTVVVDLQFVADEVKRKQDAGDDTSWNELVRIGLRSAVGRERDGVLWVHAPSADERATAIRIVDR